MQNKNSCAIGILSLALLGLSAGQVHCANLLAFPEAEGFGRYTTGARAASAPVVYHVTNLNDSGAGSLRDAVSQPGRIVVFDVSGIINLNSTLIFSGNSIIAGQTAPGEGVMIYGDRVSFSGASNLIVRYLRVHMGVGGASGKDAAGVANGANMIFDHMSVTWGRDETFSISWDSKGTEPGNITIQNSIIGQGLQTHSCGGLVQTDGGVTLFRNLYIDNKTRNPKVKGLNQFVNNVVYNWGGGGGYIMGGSAGDSWATIEDNYFIKGPSTGSTSAFVRSTETFQVYQKNNMLDYDIDGTLDGSPADAAIFSGATVVASVTGFTSAPQQHPVIASKTSADEAYQIIVNTVGASFPARDDVDEYLIAELTSLGKKGALIANESELGLSGGVGSLASGTKPKDTDNDGIPDAWEDAHGLNKNDATDAVKKDASGYLNIELYINSLITQAKGPLVSMDAGSAEQTVILGGAITSLSYTYKNCTGVTVTGLPSGVTSSVNATTKTVTISGTPTSAGNSTFTITTVGGDGDPVKVTGTILVVAAATIGNGAVPLLSLVNSAYPYDGVGVYEEKNTGWIDSGYYNFTNSTSSFAMWNLHSKTASPATMVIRYSNGGAISRNMHLEFNGANLGAVAFASTGNWTTWDSTGIPVNLVSGLNRIKLTSMSADGGPNVDEFGFSIAGVTLIKDTTVLDTMDEEDPTLVLPTPSNRKSSFGFGYNERAGVLHSPADCEARFEIFSLNGMLVSRVSKALIAGDNMVAFGKSEIPKGIYWMRLKVSGKTVFRQKISTAE